MTDQISYEHPLNETIRACLRVEHLFAQVDHHLNDFSPFGNRQVIHGVLSLLHLLDRPDLKSKLAKELTNMQVNLKRQQENLNLHPEMMKETAAKLDDLSRRLIDGSTKIAYRLRDINLLNTLRLHLANPAGDCSFDVPLYHYWLMQPASDRHALLTSWLAEFDEMRETIKCVLSLVRSSAKMSEKNAVHGFHQELLDPQSNLRMISIVLSREVTAFPEISVGRHFLSVRFFIPDIVSRPVQFKQDLRFELAYYY